MPKDEDILQLVRLQPFLSPCTLSLTRLSSIQTVGGGGLGRPDVPSELFI